MIDAKRVRYWRLRAPLTLSACSFVLFLFFLCQILDAGSKATLLRYDAAVQMQAQYRDSVLANGMNERAGYLMLEVSRSNLIADTMRGLANKSPQDLKKPLKIHFVGEKGIDAGGLRKEVAWDTREQAQEREREQMAAAGERVTRSHVALVPLLLLFVFFFSVSQFFQLIIAELFDARFGMFLVNEETRTLRSVISPGSGCTALWPLHVRLLTESFLFFFFASVQVQSGFDGE